MRKSLVRMVIKVSLIDSGVSRHMTGQHRLLSNITIIDPCYIGLPDGSQRIANSEGCCKFGSILFLNNVLFISVSQYLWS